MAEFYVDQAAGLRRLFGGGQLQAVAFAAGSEGLGRTALVANLGTALARLGKDVMLIDENAGSDDLAAHFGQTASRDLDDVLTGRCDLVDAVIELMPGLQLLPAARSLRRFGALAGRPATLLGDRLQSLDRPVDVILIDTCVRHPLGYSPFALAAHETVVVLSGHGASITEGYSLIKKGSQAFARRSFRILVNRVKTQPDARAIFDNIADVAAQRRLARLDYAGAVPLDEALRQSTRLAQPVMVTHPDSLAASSLREIAGDMLRWRQAPAEAGGVKQFFQQLLHLSQRMTPCALKTG